MKIALIIMRFPPEYHGGSEIATQSLAKNLSNRGYDIHVFTSRINNVPKMSIESGFIIHRIKTVELPLLRNIVFSIRVLWEIKDLKIDIIQSQSISVHNAGLPALVIKKILRLPYIAWGRGDDVFLSKGFEKFFNKIILKNADSVIVLTKAMGRKLSTIITIPFHIIPNGCDAEHFKNLNKDICRKKLNLKKIEKIILFVGRLHPVKGIQYLIDAMVSIEKYDKNAKLLIIGDGEERYNLESYVNKRKLKDSITFIGELPHSELPQYFAASDIFVLPSLSEGFPNVLLEAMASGLPIIATNVGGVPDIIQENINGFLVEPQNPNEIGKKLFIY
jgi:glycosyltransferase involved in cell wall biosynthesis